MRKDKQMSYETLLIEKKDHVATVTFNRPKQMNALDLVMREELKEVLADLKADSQVKVLILTGAGDKAFCAGGDIGTMANVTAPAARDRLRSVGLITKMMADMEKPIIAAVNGVAVGAGMNIALAADMIIASETARFRETFANIGLIPDLGGFYTLSVRVGMPRAKELMMTARFIEAKEAEAIGLINRIVPPDQLMKEVNALAANLAKGPSRVYGMIKTAMNLWPMNLQTYMELEANMQAVAFATKDFDEGRRSFLEKRKPEFTGE
jgi:2-(1,2-epoxy-1,2-dihydrophenyl)acetyl-CoA isomerase